MLRSTFIHLSGVGARTERNLWSEGFLDWESVLGASAVPGFGEARLEKAKRELEESVAALERSEPWYFGARLPSGNAFRGYGDFRDRALFIDIETTEGARRVSLIGTFDGGRLRFFGSGFDLDQFPEVGRAHDVWVTFNGRAFDVPILLDTFPELREHKFLHVDVRDLMFRVGLRGGLKRIEAQLGVPRPAPVMGLGGLDAVSLWKTWELESNGTCLASLVLYNLCDTVNLMALADMGYNEVLGRMSVPQPRVEEFVPGRLDVEAEVVAALARWGVELKEED